MLTERPLDHREEEEVGPAVFDIGLGFGVVFGALTVDGRSWKNGVHSVLPVHAEVEREGVRCLDRAAEAPASPGDPPPASREVLVKKVVDEWMQMAEEALASARAELEAQRRRSAINRAYYAAFYAASAMLLNRGRHLVKHAGVLHRNLVYARISAP